MKFSFALTGLLAASLSVLCAADAPQPVPKPNVLFIAIDDLRDWVSYLGDKQVKTPNLDRLAARGVAFTRGFCASPCCNPSRTALCTGQRPGQTGVYDNSDDWRRIVPAEITTLPLHFKNNGYYVAGAGKIYHESFRRESDWNDYLARQGSGDEDDPSPRRGKPGKGITSDATNNGVGGIKFKPLNCDDQDMVDYQSVSYILKKLGQPQDKPFFFARGQEGEEG